MGVVESDVVIGRLGAAAAAERWAMPHMMAVLPTPPP
jgi:hypothetical protein